MLINLKVKVNSSKSEVMKINEYNYLVFVKSKPGNNKANNELIKLLKKYFGKEVVIKLGKTQSKKIIEVKNEI